MSSFARLMDDFHNAILKNDAGVFAPQVLSNPRISPEKQMKIYTEGYRLRLLEAIQSDYPATLALLGQETFDQLACAYIEETPPTHFSLDHYPYAFASYVCANANDVLAGDVAILECAIAQTFLLEESAALAGTDLASLTPEEFGNTILVPRHASRLLAFNYPADTYLRQQRAGEAVERPDAESSYLFVVRHENEVRRHVLSQAEYLVLEQLAQGVTVGETLDRVASEYPQLLPEIAASVTTWFGAWTANGFFQGVAS